MSNKSKKHLVILGSGWAGFGFIKSINPELYKISMVSKRNHFVFTPLLASTSVGTLEPRAITESIRYHFPNINLIEAECNAIDFKNKIISCDSAFQTEKDKSNEKNTNFELSYDKLIIGVGAVTNTFGTKGVYENCLFLKEVEDSRLIRRRIIDAFELASQPNTESTKIAEILHFAVVGGGPTGVEFCAELHDFIYQDLNRIYPRLTKMAKITLFDVAPNILGSFDENLSKYATKKFKRTGIEIKNNVRIKEIKQNKIVTEAKDYNVGGLIVWATGVTHGKLVENLDKSNEGAYKVMREKWRILTDQQLQLLNQSGRPIDQNNVYALGDCATIKDRNLPATAQVANQQALYLSKILSHKNNQREFVFRNMGTMAYLGEYKAIIQLKNNKSKMPNLKGYVAWILWRSAYLSKSVSWRNKIMIVIYWAVSFISGRDTVRL